MFCSFDTLFPCVIACFCVSHALTHLSPCAFVRLSNCWASEAASEPANEQTGKWVTEGVEDVGERRSQTDSDGMNVRVWVIHDCCCNVFSLAAAVRSPIRNNTTCCCINGCNAVGLPTLCAVAATFKAAGSLQFQVWICSSFKYFQTVCVWPDRSASFLHPGFSCHSNKKLLLINNGGCSVDAPVCLVLLEVDNKERH